MLPILLTLSCLLLVGAVLGAEQAQRAAWAGLAKAGASLCFIVLALALDALSTPYGSIVLAALVLSALGDVALAWEQRGAFMTGLGLFLLAHVAFSLAFLQALLAPGVLAAAGLAMALVGVGSLRWLWPHLDAAFKAPVLAYVVAILLMCTLAIAFAAARGQCLAGAGALLFAASDLAVARQRFVRRARMNRLWGLPAYYVAQLLLAWSVAGR